MKMYLLKFFYYKSGATPRCYINGKRVSNHDYSAMWCRSMHSIRKETIDEWSIVQTMVVHA